MTTTKGPEPPSPEESLADLQADLTCLSDALEKIQGSKGWRLLAPLRWCDTQFVRVGRLWRALPPLARRAGGLVPLARVIRRLWILEGREGLTSLSRQHLGQAGPAQTPPSPTESAVTPPIEAGQGTREPEILFVSHEASRTGAPIFLLDLIRYLTVHLKMPCSILLRAGGELEGEFRSLGATYTLPDRNRMDPLVLRSLKKRNIRLVYSNTITNGLVQKRLKELGCPILCHVHELAFSIEDLFGGENLKQVKRTTTLFLAGSQAVGTYLRERQGVPEEKIALAYPFIDAGENERVARNSPPPLALPSGAVVLGACGLIGWRKGSDLFLQIAHQVLKRAGSRAFFVWVGGPVAHNDLRNLRYEAEKLGIADRVVFTGNVVSHLPYFAQFDAFLLTSREDPFPLVALDAASLGKPVVCFAGAGGAPELVQDDAGFVVPYLDVAAMAAAATALVDDAALRERLGTRAREKVIERHDTSVGGAHIAEIVRRQLARNPGSPA